MLILYVAMVQVQEEECSIRKVIQTDFALCSVTRFRSPRSLYTADDNTKAEDVRHLEDGGQARLGAPTL